MANWQSVAGEPLGVVVSPDDLAVRGEFEIVARVARVAGFDAIGADDRFIVALTQTASPAFANSSSGSDRVSASLSAAPPAW